MDLSNYTIGWADRVTYKSGTYTIGKLGGFAKLDELVGIAAGREKLNCPALYKYTGTKDTAPFVSNVFFVDIDTKNGVEEFLRDWDDFCELFPSALFAQKSASGKLHVVCGCAKTYTDELEYAKDFRLFAAGFCAAAKYVGAYANWHDLDDDRTSGLSDRSKRKPALDLAEKGKTLALFVSRNPILPNRVGHSPYIGEITKEDEKVLKSKYHRFFDTGRTAKPRDEKWEAPFDGEIEITKPKPVMVIDINTPICGYTGNEARWRVATAVLWLCGGDKTRARVILDRFFREKGGKKINWVDAEKYNPAFVQWFIAEYGVITSKELDFGGKGKEKTRVCVEGTDILLGRGEWLSDYSAQLDELCPYGWRKCITSNTGSGKTEWMKQDALAHPGSVIIVPFNSLLEQYRGVEGFNIVESKGNGWDSGKVNVINWDQFHKSENRSHAFAAMQTVYADESHEVFKAQSYRDKAAKFAEDLRGFTGRVLAITATQTNESEMLSLQGTVTAYRERNSIKCFFVETYNVEKSIRLMVNDHLKEDCNRMLAVFGNRYAKRLYEDYAVDTGFEGFGLLHSRALAGETENNTPPQGWEHSKEILSGERLLDRITFVTTTAYSGVNFRNTEPIDVAVVYKYGEVDAADIIQAVGRFRDAKDIRLWVLVDEKRAETVDETIERLARFEILRQDPSLGEIFRTEASPVYQEDEYEPTEEVLRSLDDWYFGKNGVSDVAKQLYSNAPYISDIRMSINYSVGKKGEWIGGGNEYKRQLSNDFLCVIDDFYGIAYETFLLEMVKYKHEYLNNWLRDIKNIMDTCEVGFPTVCDFMLQRSAAGGMGVDGILAELRFMRRCWDTDLAKLGSELAMGKDARKKSFYTRAAAAGYDEAARKRLYKTYAKTLETIETLEEYGMGTDGVAFEGALAAYIEDGLQDRNQQILAAKKSAGKKGGKVGGKIRKVVLLEWVGAPTALARWCKSRETLATGATRFAFASVGDAMRALNVAKATIKSIEKGNSKKTKGWKWCNADDGSFMLVNTKWERIDDREIFNVLEDIQNAENNDEVIDI